LHIIYCAICSPFSKHLFYCQAGLEQDPANAALKALLETAQVETQEPLAVQRQVRKPSEEH
jgi:hypothetical protein